MRISVILSTYNKPDDLEKVLWGYAVQTRSDFEVVVADDGSGPRTRSVIERMRQATELELRHVRHEDRGFRKSEIMNRAILASNGDYLVFSDGDSIPRDDLIAAHHRLAEPGHYLAGGYLKLPAEVSRQVTVDAVRSGTVADPGWLRARGWRPGRRRLRLVRRRPFPAIFDALTTTRANFAGNNASASRDAILEVNGFDMRMGYGGLDRAVGYRLQNLGVRGKQVRHRAVCLHLHHERPYQSDDVLDANQAILDGIRRTGETRAARGIAELDEAAAVADE